MSPSPAKARIWGCILPTEDVEIEGRARGRANSKQLVAWGPSGSTWAITAINSCITSHPCLITPLPCNATVGLMSVDPVPDPKIWQFAEFRTHSKDSDFQHHSICISIEGLMVSIGWFLGNWGNSPRQGQC